MKNRVKISIDGKSFTLVGDESEEHMRKVASYIDEKMTEMREKAVAVSMDSSLAYVLTSINVADDYFKQKAYVAELEGKLSGLTAEVQELSEKLEEAEKVRGEAEKAREEAENKLDEYTLALENGSGVQLHLSPAKNKKGKK
ncbi:cell division protein ZapA [Anaerotignum sp.]